MAKGGKKKMAEFHPLEVYHLTLISFAKFINSIGICELK